MVAASGRGTGLPWPPAKSNPGQFLRQLASRSPHLNARDTEQSNNSPPKIFPSRFRARASTNARVKLALFFAIMNSRRSFSLLMEETSDKSPVTNLANIGLCLSCRHALRVQSDRSSVFFFCELSRTDPRFPKYPRLPVLSCTGYHERDPQ